MARLMRMVPCILLLLTPSPSFCKAKFLSGFVGQELETAETENNGVLETINRDHLTNDPYNILETLNSNINDTNNSLEEDMQELPHLTLLKILKMLTSNYKSMRRTWNDLMDFCEAIKQGIINITNIPKRELPSIESIKLWWKQERQLIKTSDFFSKLQFNWKNVDNKTTTDPCQMHMSDLQVRYKSFLKYINFVQNYFYSGYIIFSMHETLGEKNIAKMKEEYISSLRQDLREDLEFFKKVMKKASREYWTCDPIDKKNRGTWFYELFAYTTYYTIQENIQEPCNGNCTHATVKECKSLYDDGLCKKTRKCNSQLQSCSLSQGMNMCIKDKHNQLNSSTYRRYTVVGQEYDYRGKPCVESIATLRYAAEIHDQSTTHKHAERFNYYNCMCRENKYFISVLPVTTSPGYFVVGAQLKLHNYTLYMSILEGKFDGNGAITDVRSVPEAVNQPEWLKNRVVLNAKARIHLSPAMVAENENRVVTGIQFSKIGRNVHLIVNSKVVNIATFTLVPDSAQIHYNAPLGKEELQLGEVDRPDKSDKENIPISNDNQFVRMNVTGLWEDGGQTTIPFIDSQQIKPKPLIPLSGVGLYIRGEKGYGGFLSLKLYTVDIVPYIEKSMAFTDNFEQLTKCSLDH